MDLGKGWFRGMGRAAFRASMPLILLVTLLSWGASGAFAQVPTSTSTPTRTLTSTPTPPGPITATWTPTRTGSPTATSTRTSTMTMTATRTPTPTLTGSPFPSHTFTSTPTLTYTPLHTSPTFTPTGSHTPTVTLSPTVTQTPTVTSSPTVTGTPTTTPTWSGGHVYTNPVTLVSGAIGCTNTVVVQVRTKYLDCRTSYILMLISTYCGGCSVDDLMTLRRTMGWDEVCGTYGIDWAAFVSDLESRTTALQPEFDTVNQILRAAANDPDAFPIVEQVPMPDNTNPGQKVTEGCAACH